MLRDDELGKFSNDFRWGYRQGIKDMIAFSETIGIFVMKKQEFPLKKLKTSDRQQKMVSKAKKLSSRIPTITTTKKSIKRNLKQKLYVAR